MSQNILENKSCTDAMRALIAVSLAERIVDSDNRSILRLVDRDLDGATCIETFVEVSALVVQNALEDAALEGITGAKQEPFSPAIFKTENILVSCEGVGDEVAGDSDTMSLCEEDVVGCGDTQLGRKLELIGALDYSPLE